MTINRAFVRNSQQTQYTILMEVLGDLSQEITMHVEPGALYSSLLTAVRRVVPCDRAQIYLYHHDKQELSPVEEVGEKILTVVQDRTALDSDDRYQRDVRRVGKWSNDR